MTGAIGFFTVTACLYVITLVVLSRPPAQEKEVVMDLLTRLVHLVCC